MEMIRRFHKVLLAMIFGAVVFAPQAFAQGKGKGGGGGGGGEKKEKAQAHAQVYASPAHASSQGQQRGNAKPHGNPQRTEGAQSRGQAARSQPHAAKAERHTEQRSAPKAHEFGGEVERGKPEHPDHPDNRGDVERGHGHFMRAVTVSELHPTLVRFYSANRPPARVAVGAVARAHLRGIDDNALVIVPTSDRVRILNRSRVMLVDLDDDRALSLGRWDVIPVGAHVKEGAPSFCRSGAGHPVWGRQWCLDKGFGLGPDHDIHWGRTTRLDDVVFLRPVGTNTLDRVALVDMLGPVVFDRLALHAITLGYVDPITGRWIGETTGPRVLLLTSGAQPVAELVDTNRDNRADMMVVALRSW